MSSRNQFTVIKSSLPQRIPWRRVSQNCVPDERSWTKCPWPMFSNTGQHTGYILKGHGNEADFLGFLQKLVPHRSLTLPFELFHFWLRIRRDIRNQKTFKPSSPLYSIHPLSFCPNYVKEFGLWWVHCKKGLASFRSQAGMSLTKLSLAGNT